MEVNLNIDPKDETVLKIPFVLEDGKKLTISLKNPKSGLTLSDVTVFTDYALGTGTEQDKVMFVKNGLSIVSVETAYLDRTNIIPLEAAV